MGSGHRTYQTFDDFNRDFIVPQSLLDQMVAEGEKQKVKPKDDEELQRTYHYLRIQIKALIARDLLDMTAYFKVWNEHSDIVKKALEIVEQ